MAWDHLSINKPHLVYIILGGFTSLFMLCSSIIKERMYIGEATVATLCGIIFGPHAANLINPYTWGNTDQITLEFSRIVLVVQCFAVGVELPKAYMERHWRSVTFLLVPVMTFGWLVTSLFIWAVLSDRLNWLDSLVIAACVTATDPVLASSVVGKGKFAKRVPKHLRDLLSAESGCNDGMAFPFIYLGLYVTKYYGNTEEVALHWICITILYECIFGAIYGVVVGYIARRAIRYAHEKDWIDRESFLVFYFVLALFCAGSGSILGMDDLLIGFACGVGFSNDGWFSEKTEEAHVSNVIDLLINLAFFVYFGTIIPWEQYNSDTLGLSPWQLVVIALMVVFFRRIPIMMALKPVIPDIKTWREALFAGHFGPIGVGAIFVAIFARADLETGGTVPTATIPGPGFPHVNVIQLIWPITTFLVLTSIIVHGSSIAVFTLGKHINTLTITMSYTQATEEGNWMDRLPRIASRSKSTMSNSRPIDSMESLEDKLQDYPSSMNLPRNFLRRQKEEDMPAKPMRSRSTSRRRHRRSGLGGPVSASAISPMPREVYSKGDADNDYDEKQDSDRAGGSSPTSSDERPGSGKEKSEVEVFQEGEDDFVIEDQRGEVQDVMQESRNATEEEKQRDLAEELVQLSSHDEQNISAHTDKEQSPHARQNRKNWLSTLRALPSFQHHRHFRAKPEANDSDQQSRSERTQAPRRRSSAGQTSSAPARAYRFGRTVIVEDEDGEVLKKIELPNPDGGGNGSALVRTTSYVDPEKTRQRLARVGSWLGMGGNFAESGENDEEEQTSSPQPPRRRSTIAEVEEDEDDRRLRFKMEGSDRRMSIAEFIEQIQKLDPKTRAEVVENANPPSNLDAVTEEEAPEQRESEEGARAVHADDEDVSPTRIPEHAVSEDLRNHSRRDVETAAERRRRLAAQQPARDDDSDDDGTARVPPSQAKRQGTGPTSTSKKTSSRSPPAPTAAATQAAGKGSQRKASPKPSEPVGETSAERRRRGASSPSKRSTTPQRPPVEEVEGETAAERRRRGASGSAKRSETPQRPSTEEAGETPAERRRREGALGISKDDSDSDTDENRPRKPPKGAVPGIPAPTLAAGPSRSILFSDERAPNSPGLSIRFADQQKGGRKGGT